MADICAYENDPYLKELEVQVLSLEEEGGDRFALLSDTVLYPEGGGQPADRGHLRGVEVLDVQRVDGALRHYLSAPVELGPAKLTLDWDRRFDHMQQHTAQHLLSALAADRFGWRTTSFHLGAHASDIELDVPAISASEMESLEQAALVEVRAGRRVRAMRVSKGELSDLGVRSRGLPEGHQGEVRLVEIEGIDLSTCGGTHLQSTAEIETVKLLGQEPMRGGVRLHWVAGGRVRWRLADHEARNEALRRLLETSDDDLVAVLTTKLQQLKGAQRTVRALERRLAGLSARSLETQTDPVVELHLEDAGGGPLEQVARQFSSSEHTGFALLTATGPGACLFAVAAGGRCRMSVQEVGAEVAAALQGRGGGRGKIFQGRAPDLAGRAEALGVLREALKRGDRGSDGSTPEEPGAGAESDLE